MSITLSCDLYLLDFTMAFNKGYLIDMAPYFDGSYYEHWRIRISIFMTSIDPYLWNIVKNNFISKPKLEWDNHDKKNFSLNIRTMHILQHALSDDIYVKVSKCINAKDILNTLDSIYLSNKCYEHVNESL